MDFLNRPKGAKGGCLEPLSFKQIAWSKGHIAGRHRFWKEDGLGFTLRCQKTTSKTAGGEIPRRPFGYAQSFVFT